MKYTVDEQNKEIIFLEDTSYEELLDFLQTHTEFKLWEMRLTTKVVDSNLPVIPAPFIFPWQITYTNGTL